MSYKAGLHRKPKRRLESAITWIGFNDHGDPGIDEDGSECPPVEWSRRDGHFFREESPLVDGYYIDYDAPARSRQTTVRKALFEALEGPAEIWIDGLSNLEIVHLLTHSDYFDRVKEWAEDEVRFTVNRSVIFEYDDQMMWEMGPEFEERHLKRFPSQGIPGPWWSEECEDCLMSGVCLTTEKKCRSCGGTGYLRDE